MMKPRWLVAATLAATLALMAAATIIPDPPDPQTARTPFSISSADAATTLVPTHLARHPDIDAKPASAHAINDIGSHGGKLYLGYGDWNRNTGTVTAAWINLLGETGTSLTPIPTEAINTWRTFDGHLYAPYIDPTLCGICGNPGNGGYATTDPNWRNVHTYPAAHVFDIAKLGTDLFTVGSGPDGAIVYRSRDVGATWNLILAEKSPGGVTGWERFYYAIENNGKVYVQAAHKGYSTGCNCSSGELFPMRAWNGTRWEKVNNRASLGYIGAGHQVESFKGFIYSPRYVSNGKNRVATGVPNGVVDWFKTDNHLYAIAADGTVARTVGIATLHTPAWEVFTGKAVPPGEFARSIAILGDKLVAGTADGDVYVTAY